MRTTFLKTLLDLAQEDESIWLLTGDLGYSVLEPFAERFPNRFVNMGVAEQNMTGLAAGLAMTGKTVFTYSIANFPIMRCLEQIRNDVCYHNLNVKVVAVGGGLSYGGLGYTHHAVEDIGVLRLLPHMRVVAPGDPVEVRLATRAVAKTHGPCYLRIGKAGEPILHAHEPIFELGRAIQMHAGREVTLISTGAVLDLALAATQKLEQSGRSVRLLSMPTVHPIDAQAIEDAALQTGHLVTIEEHGLGGLYSAVAEQICQMRRSVRLDSVRLGSQPLHTAGTQEQLRASHGLTVDKILEACR